MNYEILIWLEPLADGFRFPLVLIAIFSILAAAGCALTATLAPESEMRGEMRTRVSKLARKCLIVGIVTTILAGISNPFAQFTEVYKKLLIYRGINSALADKSIDTADKALDLLNTKIDKELELMKGEVQSEQK